MGMQNRISQFIPMTSVCNGKIVSAINYLHKKNYGVTLDYIIRKDTTEPDDKKQGITRSSIMRF